jgi:type 2 lantibiotic biosynthesis protein LanM
VVLFLAYLGELTGEGRWTGLAQAALTALRRQLERNRASLSSVGGFNGWGGVIYTLTQLAALWKQPALLDEANAEVGQLPALIERDEALDLIGGAAGCLASLLTLHQYAPSARTLAAMAQCGDRLLARAQPQDKGLGWVTPVPATGPLTGFSHGAAGVAWALLELAAVAGAERFRSAALAATAYERSLFCPGACNWPDLRYWGPPGQAPASAQAAFLTAWCHGAPGIGLARLRGLRHQDDPQARAEVAAALQTTLAQGFGANHCLCHGDLGNLELFLQAGEALADPRWRAEADRLGGLVLDDIDRRGWRCGLPDGVESPGLMTGLAGIGYGLLRLADPARVPSVLVLEPPR